MGEFDKDGQRKSAIEYIEDIFNLKKGTAGAVNYLTETLNLLEFGNVIEKKNTHSYRIVRGDIMEFLCDCPENSYIFLYLLTYQTFKHDGILELFKEYCLVGDLARKKVIISNILELFVQKSISIGNSQSNWSKQLVKYSLIILGYVNNQNYITRTLNISDRLIEVKDISLNIGGTRTPYYLPKKNDYIQAFSSDYVSSVLSQFLLVKKEINQSKTAIFQSLASDLADLKLDVIKFKDNNRGTQFDKQQFVDLENKIRRRNPSIQNTFRKNLHQYNENSCPVCGFSFEQFLIASHIKPYTVCDNTYDAINHHNGLLLCPNHDKLFEGARYMTIDNKTGEIILNSLAKKSKEFGILAGTFVDKRLVNCERTHYLKWHNDQFRKNN
jgi:hypothetical protein